MSDLAIQIENLSKEYRLGTVSHGMLYRDIQAWWARLRGKEDPNSTLGSQQLSRSRGKDRFWALKDINLEVRQGDTVGIIGRNGAGKSTLLKILSRVTAPTKGTIRLRGRVASLLEVGTGFHPELTGRENIYLNGAIMGMTKKEIRRKFDEIVDFAEVEKFIDTPVKRYSSGMYVRLAFAVAAHLEPEILIVDEVLAVGDAQFQKKCLGKMQDVSKKEGRTILFVSHNMGAIRSLCSRGLCLLNGRVISEGSILHVVNEYLADGVASSATVTYPVDKLKPIHITRARILDYKGAPSSCLDMLQPFRIEVEYIVNEPMRGIVIGCNIFSSLGESIIATTDCDLDRNKLGTRNMGINRTYVDIPSRILNSGTYLLVIGISIPGKYIYDRQEVMNFELYDSGSFVVNGGGEERRNSLLLLGLAWNT